MFTGPSYSAVTKDGELYIYSDDMRKLERVYVEPKRAIIDALYSFGLKAADRKAKDLNVDRIK